MNEPGFEKGGLKKLYAVENADAGADTCSGCGKYTDGAECNCNGDIPITVSMSRTVEPSEAEFFLQA